MASFTASPFRYSLVSSRVNLALYNRFGPLWLAKSNPERTESADMTQRSSKNRLNLANLIVGLQFKCAKELWDKVCH